MTDLHILPKVRDSWSYLYVEHCRVEQEAKAIALFDEAGVVSAPCATLTLLMLGPGTSVSHAAIRQLAEAGCLVCWTGEEGVRFYAQGLGETRSAGGLIRQAWLASDPGRRLEVALRMYRRRFHEPLSEGLTLQQVRGREGIRVRESYARASRETGVPWAGRSYRRDRWADADPVNRALSCANSCLYGVCHAAIVAAGYSPGLGFIHTGKQLSFVYDIADLYKADVAIPAAFRAAAEGSTGLESRVRHACRDTFREERLLARIVPDIQAVLSVDLPGDPGFDADAALPGGLWDPELGSVAGGVNHSDGVGSDAAGHAAARRDRRDPAQPVAGGTNDGGEGEPWS
jgi:CRISPR-associated protein Cas1